MKEQTIEEDVRFQIRNKLLNINTYITEENLFYGLKTGVESETWNYVVFGKAKFKRTSSGLSYIDNYYVDIIRENYIPDDMVISIIEELESIPGVKLCENDCVIEYVDKTSEVVCEVCRIMFAAPKKKINHA